MNDLKFGCPKCERPFRVTPEFAGEVVQCPHCGKQVRLPALLDVLGESPDPGVLNSVAEEPASFDSEAETRSSEAILPASFEVHEIAHDSGNGTDIVSTETEQLVGVSPASSSSAAALPPKFEVDDPGRIRYRTGNESKVILPTADGGVQTIDNRLVTIEYKGQKYTVVALSPEEKRRRQLIVNILSIFIAIAAIIGTFWILLG
jgi:DNA-directed RNA polymerase subunit RPC12/RpoP